MQFTKTALKYLWLIIGPAVLLLLPRIGRADVRPYIADGNTVFLFHFDEAAGGSVATNSAGLSTGTNLVSFTGNPFAGDNTDQSSVTTVLGATGYAAFGNCATGGAGTDLGLGLDASRNGAFRLDDGMPISNDRLPTHIFFGPGNTFTLEALINVSTITGFNQEIISTDHGSANADRGLQFRITPAGNLEFNFVGVATTSVTNPIPTSGPDAFVPGEWFHVALAYDGVSATFYWTRLNSGATHAKMLGTPLAEGVDVGDDMLLVIGNEGRAVGATGATEGLRGLIDEVRISNVARGSNAFVFRSVVVLEATGTELPNVPGNTLDGSLATRWSAQFDGQYITYDLGRSELVESIDLAFYQPAGIRSNYFAVLVSNDNVTWRPVLTNGVGTNAVLVNFDLASWPARYVRYVGHVNSVNDFNSLTEAVIHSSPLTDTDGDALPDFWENYYFTNLLQTGTGDPDADLQPNAFEYEHGTDPTQFNTSGDADGDGLPDTWEQMWFGGLGQPGAGDYDGDGSSNLAEYEGATNPTHPNLFPGAIGGVSPRVAFLRDSVPATNACLMPDGSTYGRAINGISFQNNNILLTFNGYQYTAWYDTVGTSQFVWLARRSVTNTTAGAWEKYLTDAEFVNGDEPAWDAHNVIALGICPDDGTLHLSWDHHNDTLRYRRSFAGLCTTNTALWGTTNMLGTNRNWLVSAGQSVTDVTYPQFTTTPTGGLVLNLRVGSSGNGDQVLYQYNPIVGGTGGNWNPSRLFLIRTGNYNGSPSRCAYINGLDYGPDGKLHVTWTWREGAGTSNHDICYAYSTDGGLTWRNNAGTIIADTGLGQSVSLNSPGIVIKPLDLNQLLINQQAQCVDRDGCVHVLMLHRRQEPGYEHPNYTTAAFSTLATAYYHYFRNPTNGVWTTRRLPVDVYPVGSRPKIGSDAKGNVYVAYLSYPAGTAVPPGSTTGKLVIASASKAARYTDWAVVQVNPAAFNGEPLLDQSRLLADNILAVYIQEHSTTTTVIGTALHAFDFAVGVAETNPLSLSFLETDSLVVLTATNTASYQLQSTSTLNPTIWSNVGPAAPGINGLLALPHPNGRSSNQLFYRVLQSP